ncbi:MAG: hypothetical protein HC845_02595 [Akkermansiaceae bacterium]|nr:hypothetical protein [Akkermansiaceae bacterium]
MQTSDSFKWFLILCLWSSSGILRADKLILKSNARLTGTVSSISEKGVIALASEIASQPVLLKPGVVQKVEFSSLEPHSDSASTLIELINGDILPVTIDNLNEKELVVRTSSAGDFKIPRHVLKSMQLRYHKEKVIYRGPQKITEWISDNEDARGWKFSDNSFTTDDSAFASKKFELPLKFSLKFKLKWQESPNFQINFADPLSSDSKPTDRYMMIFNDNKGLEIKRESSKGNRHQAVILLPRRIPADYPENKLDVEILVDRKASLLELRLNGEPETKGIDPAGQAPTGNGVSLYGEPQTGKEQSISDIEIREFDNAAARHLSENRGDEKSDSLISRDEDRWSGSLLSIKTNPEGLALSFKSDFQDEPLELSENEVSTIFFAQIDQETKTEKENEYALRLVENGVLRVKTCTFSDDFITAQHPLLGMLKINRSGVSALEWISSQQETQQKEKTEE